MIKTKADISKFETTIQLLKCMLQNINCYGIIACDMEKGFETFEVYIHNFE